MENYKEEITRVSKQAAIIKSCILLLIIALVISLSADIANAMIINHQ